MNSSPAVRQESASAPTRPLITCCDAHNHLQHPALAEYLPVLLRELPVCCVAGGVINGTHPRDWAAVRKICAEHAEWIPAYGVHPWEVEDLPEDWFCVWQDLLQSPLATVGEIGLDLWRSRENFSLQLEVFGRQWRWAAENHRPVTVHCLRAWPELRQFMKTAPVLGGGFLLHAYGGPESEVDFWVEQGAFFSFSPSFLGRPRKLAPFRRVPLDRLLLETDAPSMPAPPEFCPSSLPPAPDGTPLHDPRNLPAQALHLAEILHVAPDTLSQQTTQNFSRLFFAGK